MPDHQLLITGGTVVDGTRSPRFEADVAVDDGRISAVGDLSARTSAERIDARGLVVAPGFIDCHTHDDQALLSQPEMAFKVSQGVTTVVGGNCGISLAPLLPDTPLPPPLNLLEAAERARFASLGAYFGELERRPASVNVAMLAGHSTLRVRTMDRLDRPARADEIGAMQGLLQQALDDGALGLSTGTFYPPAFHASTEEIVAVGRPLSAARALYVTHMRDEGSAVMEALDETFRIGRALDVAVVVSHHKVMNAANFGRSSETLAFIHRTMQHQCVGLDCYPYTAGSTMIRADRGMLEGRVRIASSVPHPECAGRDLADIAAEWGVDRVEAARRLQPGSAVYFLMDEPDVRAILAFDHTMVGSDGIPVGERPHPRLWGTFPRVLGHYCRGLGLFPLETAVWKMTGLTARTFGLHDRGRVAAGLAADLTLFDPDTVADRADYDEPTRAADGIAWVLVNGRATWQHGQHLGTRAGQVLRRS